MRFKFRLIVIMNFGHPAVSHLPVFIYGMKTTEVLPNEVYAQKAKSLTFKIIMQAFSVFIWNFGKLKISKEPDFTVKKWNFLNLLSLSIKWSMHWCVMCVFVILWAVLCRTLSSLNQSEIASLSSQDICIRESGFFYNVGDTLWGTACECSII